MEYYAIHQIFKEERVNYIIINYSAPYIQRTSLLRRGFEQMWVLVKDKVEFSLVELDRFGALLKLINFLAFWTRFELGD